MEPDEAAMRVGWRVQARRGGSGARAARRRRRGTLGGERRAAWWRWRSGWDLRRGRSMAGGGGFSSGSARGLVVR